MTLGQSEICSHENRREPIENKDKTSFGATSCGRIFTPSSLHRESKVARVFADFLREELLSLLTSYIIFTLRTKNCKAKHWNRSFVVVEHIEVCNISKQSLYLSSFVWSHAVRAIFSQRSVGIRAQVRDYECTKHRKFETKDHFQPININ